MRTQHNDPNEEFLWSQNSPSHPMNGELKKNGKRGIDNPDLNRDRNTAFDKDRNFDDDDEEEDNDDFLDDGFDDDDDYDSLTDDEDADDDPQQTKRNQKRTGSDTNPE